MIKKLYEFLKDTNSLKLKLFFFSIIFIIVGMVFIGGGLGLGVVFIRGELGLQFVKVGVWVGIFLGFGIGLVIASIIAFKVMKYLLIYNKDKL